MKRLVIGAVLLVCAAGTAAAADDAILKQMVGEWIGRGTVRLKADEEPQRLFCKVTNALDGSGHSLHQIGRCALPKMSVAIEAVIEAVGTGRYRGSAGRHGSPPAATFSGTARSDRLVLTAETGDDDKSTATATLDVADDGFRIRAVAVDPKTKATYTVSDVVFRHQ